MTKVVTTKNQNQASAESNKLAGDTAELSLQEKLFSETARIAWHDLQRFFAQGVVLQIDESLDLIEVAILIANDITNDLQVLIQKGLVAAPSNDTARDWYQKNIELWSVVVAPYVLVQNKQ